MFSINEVIKDEFGRYEGVLLVNKPVGITSHDVVDQARKHFGTRKVGHAGTLDPFAEGLMILLIGKSTKLSDRFLGMNKEYEATILFGVSTVTGDIDGETKDFSTTSPSSINDQYVRGAFQKFRPHYEQFVPLYSSVKVGGRKLRILARKYHKNQMIEHDGNRKYLFRNDRNEVVDEVVIPKKLVYINEIELVSKITSVNIISANYNFSERLKDYPLVISDGSLEFNPNLYKSFMHLGIDKLPIAKIRVSCSKGTYIRQLAEDIGSSMNPSIPSMLIELKRTRIGDYSINDTFEIDELPL